MNKKISTVITTVFVMTVCNLILSFDTISVFARTPANTSVGASIFTNKEKIVIDFLKKDFKKDKIQMGRNPKFKIEPIMSTDRWFTAVWMITSNENPNGWAGSLLFKKDKGLWVYTLGTQTFEGAVKELTSVGMTPAEVEFFADKQDR